MYTHTHYKTKETTKMKNTHWVVVAEWCVDFENGLCIIGVYHSKEAAKKAFKHRVDTDDRIIAEKQGYDVIDETETDFEAYIDGEYSSNHVSVSIIKTETEE